MTIKIKNILLVVLLLTSFSGFSQSDKSFEKELDTVFKDLNNAEQPGVAAAIIKDGQVIYLKGFGSANLETKEEITPQTKFQLGEMSKQFTTLGILILEKEGKISFNDNIRKHIPELSKYPHTITIGHLLNHSSGLYDITRIKTVISGTETVKTQTEAINLVAAQKTLAFTPGTDFSFHESPTESILMAEIIARSSGQSFADFVKNKIFTPLGMNNSLIRDNSNMIIDKVAHPYQMEKDKGYRKNEVNSSVVGAINAYSTAEDLAKWYLNFMNPKGELGELVQRLNAPVKLSNGKKFVYYWGEMAIGREFTHPERGLPIFWNFGFQGGYGTNIFRYLNQNIISFALGNNNQYNGGLAMNAVDVFVKDLYTLPPVIDFKTKNIKKLSTSQLQTFAGNYWFPKAGYASKLFVENDTLRSKWIFSKNAIKLVPLSDNTFQQYAEMEDERLFKFKTKGTESVLSFTYNDSEPDVMKRYEPVNPSEQELQSYAGVYYNKAYAALFSFRVEDGQLVVKNLDHSDIKFTPITKDVFTSTSMFFNALKFLRNTSNEVKGFTIDTDGIHNLEFEKIPEGLMNK